MKIVIYISVLLGMFVANAQEAYEAENVTNELSFSFNGDLSFSGNDNMYFSTSDSDDSFKVRAKFPDRKTQKIRAYLKEELGLENMRVTGNKMYWKMRYNDNTAYEVKVDDGSLRMNVKKELVSTSMFNKLKAMAKNIKEYTSGKSQEKRNEEQLQKEEQRLNREAEKLLRQAEQKTREAERLQREVERLKRETARKTD